MSATKLQAAQRLLSNRKQTLALLEKISAEGGEPTLLQLEEFRFLAAEAGEYELELATASDDPIGELERLFALEDPRQGLKGEADHRGLE